VTGDTWQEDANSNTKQSVNEAEPFPKISTAIEIIGEFTIGMNARLGCAYKLRCSIGVSVGLDITGEIIGIGFGTGGNFFDFGQ